MVYFYEKKWAGEAVQVFLCSVGRLKVILDRHEKRTHGTAKAVVEPGAV